MFICRSKIEQHPLRKVKPRFKKARIGLPPMICARSWGCSYAPPALDAESLRGSGYDERALFHTYDDIVEMRRRDRITSFIDTANGLQKENVLLQASNARLLEQNTSLKEKLEAQEAVLDRDLVGELHQYEDEWTKCQNALCELKDQITEVVAGMYRRETPRLGTIPCGAEIAHLLEAAGFLAHPLSPNSAK